VDFDLTDLDLFEKGFPQHVFTWLRREAPVYWHEPTSHTPDGEGFWVVSRHADALRVLLDPVAYLVGDGRHAAARRIVPPGHAVRRA
jgi:cytochrome P450